MKAVWKGETIAASSDTVVVEGNREGFLSSERDLEA